MPDHAPFALRPLSIAHEWVKAVVRPGARVADATAGNGRDTLFLAELVGEGGMVYAFDIQPEAVDITRRAAEAAGVQDRVDLHACSHARMSEFAPRGLEAVMFNLGYLPGGDKNITTTIEETLPALDAAFERLGPGGIMTVMCYPGHEGGRDECEAVERAWSPLPLAEGLVCILRSLNGAADAPFLMGVQKKGGPR